MNAYEIYTEIREGIGESSAAHWSDVALLRKMNQAQKKLWQDLANTPGDWLLTSTDLTPVDSVITFPDDCGKPVYMEHKGNGSEIPLNGSVRNRRITRGVDTVNPYEGMTSAYLTAVGAEVNADGYTDTVTLWYLQRVQDMHFGTAGASSAATKLHFDTAKTPKYEDDYYNNLKVEIWSSASVPAIQDTITDYAASTNLATITGTAEANQLYGTVPQIPEEGHYLIVLECIHRCLLKPGSAFDVEYLKMNYMEYKEARKEWLEWIEQRASRPSFISIGEID